MAAFGERGSPEMELVARERSNRRFEDGLIAAIELQAVAALMEDDRRDEVAFGGDEAEARVEAKPFPGASRNETFLHGSSRRAGVEASFGVHPAVDFDEGLVTVVSHAPNSKENKQKKKRTGPPFKRISSGPSSLL